MCVASAGGDEKPASVHESSAREDSAQERSAAARRTCVLLCSDSPPSADALREAVGARLGARCELLRWSDVEDTHEAAALRDIWSTLHGRSDAAGGSAGDAAGDVAARANAASLELVRDWWVMTRADVLAASNSTFSITAAMLSRWAAAASSETPNSDADPEPHKRPLGSTLSFNVNAKVRPTSLILSAEAEATWELRLGSITALNLPETEAGARLFGAKQDL